MDSIGTTLAAGESKLTGRLRLAAEVSRAAVMLLALVLMYCLTLESFYPGGVSGYAHEAGSLLDNIAASGLGF